jgi:hypothetical protein
MRGSSQWIGAWVGYAVDAFTETGKGQLQIALDALVVGWSPTLAARFPLLASTRG